MNCQCGKPATTWAVRSVELVQGKRLERKFCSRECKHAWQAAGGFSNENIDAMLKAGNVVVYKRPAL